MLKRKIDNQKFIERTINYIKLTKGSSPSYKYISSNISLSENKEIRLKEKEEYNYHALLYLEQYLESRKLEEAVILTCDEEAIASSISVLL